MIVASLGFASQLTLAVTDILHHVSSWSALYGAALAGIIIPLVLRRKLRLQHIDFGVLVAASLGLLIQLVHALFLPRAPEPQLYFIGAFLFVVAFSALPIRWAGLYSAALYLLYVALTLIRSGNPVFLIDLAVIVLLIAHFSVFGDRISGERAGSLAYQRLALTDPLTRLENRRAMHQRLEWAAQQSQAGHVTAILLLDLDHFKRVNDLYGHPVGDLVLQRVAGVLTRTLRQGDTVARWGGEEFLMLIDCSERSIALEVAQRVLNALRASPMPLQLLVTASCGMCCSDEVESVDEWLSLVDERLYSAKQNGRDCLRAY